MSEYRALAEISVVSDFASLVLGVEHLGIAVSDVYHGFHSLEVCVWSATDAHNIISDLQDENSPMPLSGPISVLAMTRTLKSFCTLPMISTALLS